MRIKVKTRDFLIELSLFLKDYSSEEDMAIDAATISIEEYFTRCKKRQDEFELPFFLETSINKKKYMVNSIVALENASMYSHAEQMKHCMFDEDLDVELINTKIERLK